MSQPESDSADSIPLPISRPTSSDHPRDDQIPFQHNSTSPTSPSSPLKENCSNSNGYGNGNGAHLVEEQEDGHREEQPQVEEEHDSPKLREVTAALEKMTEERDTFEAQYRSLLGKLTTMRNTLGDKLKQDADELDRREAEINDLRAANEDLQSTIETLKVELIQSNEESEVVHSELEQLRLRAFDSQRQSSEEVSTRERALRDAQEDLERERIEKEEWEGEAMRERVRREEVLARLGSVEMELGMAKSDREVLREERDREAEAASNLHAVLQEFQAAKDKELKATLGDLQAQLRTTNESLAEFKQRATLAEGKLSAAQNDSEKVLALTKDAKDKSLLIGKLRHEAVILNEHLTEALRRLKRDSAENSVDRRLISNVLISFLNTPRGDTKRFEMLQLISSILSWSDDQREQVGLQRSSGIMGAPGLISSGARGGAKGHSRSGKGKAVDDGLGENEGFGQLWVEFLLKEASAANAGPPQIPSISPLSPGTPAPGSPNLGGGAFSPSRFDVSQLPPLVSPPLVSPSASGTSTRRPSFTTTSVSSRASESSGGGSGTTTGPSSVKGSDR